jgi:hypothetical protein
MWTVLLMPSYRRLSETSLMAIQMQGGCCWSLHIGKQVGSLFLRVGFTTEQEAGHMPQALCC